MVAPYPAGMVLPAERLRRRYRSRPEHAAPWVRSLTTALSKRDDVEFHVFTHSRAVSSVQDGEENGVPFTVIPQYEPGRIGCWHYHLPARMQFRAHIRRYSPDLVHGFGTESSYGLIASEQRVPGTVFIQGIQEHLAPYYDQYSRALKVLRQRLELRVVRKVAGLIAETGFAERWGRQVNPQAELAVIPHAVNPEFLMIQSDHSEVRCLCIGTVSRTKAVDVVIRAFAKTANRALRLEVIGSGMLLDEMKQLAAQLGVSDRVSFLGHRSRDEILARMRSARMLAILSRMDTSPNILTEAHAAGLPVIGTRAGGIPDMIDDGRDGFLVDVDDVDRVARKMDLLASDISLARRLGSAGREKVMWLNDPDRIAELHMQFFRRVLSNTRGGHETDCI